MSLLVGPPALVPAVGAIVLLALLQWRRLERGRWEPRLAVATGVLTTWAVVVAVLRFVTGL